MHVILIVFAALALLGFVASVVVHLAGYAGVAEPFGIDPWPLHIGIFVVWFPAVLIAQRSSRDFPQKDLWKATLRGCPAWMRVSLYGLFGYAFLSFFMFFLGSFNDLGEPNAAQEVRGFSGHWLVFYYAAFAILYSAIQVGRSDPALRCGNGHVVNPFHKFCPTCGVGVDTSGEDAS